MLLNVGWLLVDLNWSCGGVLVEFGRCLWDFMWMSVNVGWVLVDVEWIWGGCLMDFGSFFLHGCVWMLINVGWMLVEFRWICFCFRAEDL